MMKKSFDFRFSSLSERKEFYEREFKIWEVRKWFEKTRMKISQICAVDAGTESGIILNKELKNWMLYFPFSELKEKILKYLPEDVYYDRNFYSNAEKVLRELKFNEWKEQELVFDVDVDNISCNHSKKESVCEKCLRKAYLSTIKMKKVLEEENFRKIKIIYSGRGFHLHVFDRKAFLMTEDERKKLAAGFKKFPIDAWVSAGNISLIRMPFSLNGLVSRKVVPLENEKDLENSIPAFLKN